MNQTEFIQAVALLKEAAIFNTWTAKKHQLVDDAIGIVISGRHEFFNSKPLYHTGNVGSYYIEECTHKRRGTLMKYRGNKILVICCRRGSWNTREFLIGIVE